MEEEGFRGGYLLRQRKSTTGTTYHIPSVNLKNMGKKKKKKPTKKRGIVCRAFINTL